MKLLGIGIALSLSLAALSYADEHGHGPGHDHGPPQIGGESRGLDGITYLNMGAAISLGTTTLKPRLTSRKQIHYGAVATLSAIETEKMDFQSLKIDLANLKKEFRASAEKKAGELVVIWEVSQDEASDQLVSVELLFESTDAAGAVSSRLRVFTVNEGRYSVSAASLTALKPGKVRLAVKKSKAIVLEGSEHSLNVINYVTSTVVNL